MTRATRFPGLDEPTSRAIILRQGYWKALGTWSPAAWELNFVGRASGAPIGVQVVEGTEFPSVRTVDSASWLVEHQRGRGHGKAMRLAVLALAFDHLGALAAITAAWQNNLASLGVSRAIGSLSNGVSLQLRDNSLETMVHLRSSRKDWLSRQRPTVEVAGLDAALPLFGQ